MSNLIINGQRIRYYREAHIDAKGQAWVCVKDILTAAGIYTTTNYSARPTLNEWVGEEAVSTMMETQAIPRRTYQLNYVKAEHVLQLLRRGRPGRTSAIAYTIANKVSEFFDIGVLTAAFTAPKPAPEVEPTPTRPEQVEKPERHTFRFRSQRQLAEERDGLCLDVAREYLHKLPEQEILDRATEIVKDRLAKKKAEIERDAALLAALAA